MSTWIRRLAPAAALILLGLGAYANSHRGDFVYDDLAQIRDNPAVRDPAGLLKGTARGSTPPNRVVGYLTFAASYRAGGLAVGGWHAANLAIHLAAALLLYALVLGLLRAPRLAGSALEPHARAVAISTAALFVTHPLQTQAVSYVVQRLTSLAAALYLAAAVAYLAWRRGQEDVASGRGSGWGWYAISLAAGFLALRTKEIAFTLPLALLLLERLLHGPLTPRRWLWLAPFAALALQIPLGVLRAGAPAGLVVGDADRIAKVQTAMGRLDYLRNQVPIVVDYLGLLAWPAGQSVDHDPPVFSSWLQPQVLLSLLFHGGLALAAGTALWRTRARAREPADPGWRLVAVGMAWFYLTLAVESSLVPIVDLMVEHRVYLPSAGAFLAVVAAGALLAVRLAGRLPARALVAVAIGLSLALGFATLLRNRVWFTELSLWRDAAEKAPAKVRPRINLGTKLLEEGQREAALEQLHLAARLAPDMAHARAQLGAALLASGREAEAEGELRETLRLDPADLETLFNLAELLQRRGRRDEARPLYTRFLETAPPARYADALRVAQARLR